MSSERLREALQRITELDCSFENYPLGKAHEIAKAALATAKSTAMSSDLRNKLASLVAKWRDLSGFHSKLAEEEAKFGFVESRWAHQAAAEKYKVCADEVEALLRETAEKKYEPVGDNNIFLLACKLVDTAGGDRKTYWLPVLSQLCEAVRKQDAETHALARTGRN